MIFRELCFELELLQAFKGQDSLTWQALRKAPDGSGCSRIVLCVMFSARMYLEGRHGVGSWCCLAQERLETSPSQGLMVQAQGSVPVERTERYPLLC